jgi:hypothetical protein
MGETVWDQQVRYFESRGEVRQPRLMFQADLLNLIRIWKTVGDKFILLGDFNKNVYEGKFALDLLGNEFRMSELCLWIMGSRLSNTHIPGSVPIDAVFATAGISSTAVMLLPYRVGVGNHRVFLLDINSDTLLEDVFPCVIPVARRLLNCASDWIKKNYILVLNQLSNRHRIFKKLSYIDRESDRLTQAQLQLQMNKVDLELEEFMKSSKKGCHKLKRDIIEWSPYAKVWIHWRWLLKRVEWYLEGKTRDPQNLIHDCHCRGIKTLCKYQWINSRPSFFVCKRNISPYEK